MSEVPQFTYGNQFHLLRHFKKIDQAYRRSLNVSGFSDARIDEQLSMAGSKFFRAFASNPEKLWQKACQHPDFSIPGPADWMENRYIFELEFGVDEYPEGIGTDSLVSLDSLSADDLKKVSIQLRGGIPVKHFPAEQPISSWTLNIILGRAEKLFVRTMFPGTYAPAFPDLQKQDKQAYKMSTDFWEGHALLQ